MSTVPLDHPITIQEEVLTSSVEILDLREDYVNKSVTVRLKTSDNPLTFDSFQVWDADTYNVDWTQSDLEEAIIQHYDSVNGNLGIV